MNKLPLPEHGEIVVGLDGSAVSEAAVRWAVSEAERSGRAVRVLHAWTYAPLRGQQISAHEARVAQRQGVENLVSALIGDEPPVTIRYEITEDTAVGALVRASRTAAMLVLGSHGHGRLVRALLGSVSSRCLREAVCPVVLIPARTVQEDGESDAEPLSGTYLPGPLL